MIGASAGGVKAVQELLQGIPKPLPFPVIVVLHRLKNVQSNLAMLLQNFSCMPVSEAMDKEDLKAGQVYIAPANYHLLIERDFSISLSVSEVVNMSRPSIDVSLLSAADVCGEKCIGILLTGASKDGAQGMRHMHNLGADLMVQDLNEANVKLMPQSALNICPDIPQRSLHQISEHLNAKVES